MRQFLAWSFGIITFILMAFITNEIATNLGIVTYVDFGETLILHNRYYTEEIDGANTAFGNFFLFLTFATAIRVGMAIFTGKLSGNVSWNGNLMLFVITFALLLYGISNQIIFELLDFHKYLSILLHLVVLVGIIWASRYFYNAKKRDKL